jgi:hypothetical protein
MRHCITLSPFAKFALRAFYKECYQRFGQLDEPGASLPIPFVLNHRIPYITQSKGTSHVSAHTTLRLAVQPFPERHFVFYRPFATREEIEIMKPNPFNVLFCLDFISQHSSGLTEVAPPSQSILIRSLDGFEIQRSDGKVIAHLRDVESFFNSLQKHTRGFMYFGSIYKPIPNGSYKNPLFKEKFQFCIGTVAQDWKEKHLVQKLRSSFEQYTLLKHSKVDQSTRKKIAL